jgi:hypothetical protein
VIVQAFELWDHGGYVLQLPEQEFGGQAAAATDVP